VRATQLLGQIRTLNAAVEARRVRVRMAWRVSEQASEQASERRLSDTKRCGEHRLSSSG
jgi:hypothetical protein